MYIVVEGCIGSGKTTVAKLLAVERNSSLVPEDYQANSFLDKFYSNPSNQIRMAKKSAFFVHFFLDFCLHFC